MNLKELLPFINFYEAYSPNPDLINLSAGGFVEFHASFSYEFQSLPYHLLVYTVLGNGILTTSSKNLSVSENTLLFFDCNQPFKLSSVSASGNFYIAFLTGNALSTYEHYLAESSGALYSLPKTSGIPAFIKHLADYSDIRTAADALTVSKWLTDILTEACVVSAKQNEPQEHIPAYLSSMKLLLENSYTINFSLADLEERFSVSKYRLCREFSSQYQVSPLQFLNARRIEAAKDLLLTTDMPVHEVGSSVGIENTNHFINLFKKFTGTTPFAFKQEAPASIRGLHSPYKPDVPPQ